MNTFGVFYKVTKEGKLFAGLTDELIYSFENQDYAIEACRVLNVTGYIDELHDGYVVKKLS